MSKCKDLSKDEVPAWVDLKDVMNWSEFRPPFFAGVGRPTTGRIHVPGDDETHTPAASAVGVSQKQLHAKLRW